MNGSLRYALLTALPVLVILAAVAFLNPKRNYWGSPELPRAQCEAYSAHRLSALPEATDEIYDQRKLDRMVREPQNTTSSLAYAIVGLAIVVASYQLASRVLGTAAILLGLSSAFYHVTLLSESSVIDMITTYVVLYSLALVGASANVAWLKRPFVVWILASASWLLAFYTGIWRNDTITTGIRWFDSTDVFAIVGVMIGLLVYATRRTTRDPKRYKRAVIAFVGSSLVALAGLLGDRFGGFWATPDASVQGHTVWHTFSAVALLAAYEAFATTGFDHSTLGRRQVKVTN